jgi:hypothetical protein
MYLLEIQELGVGIVYALESEGHEDGYSLDTFISGLEGWARQYNNQDC